ncbi:MAG: hypothetical protein M1429_00465 [Patescibacteria group bacterium]|nr:hypothetical protein [Patescibacteria group bacterium]
MKNKVNSTTKWLLIILTILVIITVAMSIWRFAYNGINFIPTTVKNDTPIVTSNLNGEKEQAIGTIIYPGVDSNKIEILKNDLAQKIIFETQDSPDGVISIYSQDLLNRYKNATCSKKEIKKNDATDQKATQLTCSQGNGKIMVTTWFNTNGLTSAQIEKENSF